MWQEKQEKKNCKDWIEYYKKILSDGFVFIGKTQIRVLLCNDDRRYIEGQIKRLMGEISDGCE